MGCDEENNSRLTYDEHFELWVTEHTRLSRLIVNTIKDEGGVSSCEDPSYQILIRKMQGYELKPVPTEDTSQVRGEQDPDLNQPLSLSSLGCETTTGT